MFLKSYIFHKTAKLMFRSLSTHPSSSSTSSTLELENLRYLARALWALGEERSITGKTNGNIYRHFREEKQGNQTITPTHNLADWTQIDGIIRDFGIPEMADHISGAFYRFANIEEDRCSQCIRIADSVKNFSIDELKYCLNTMAWWSSEVQNSSSVRDVIKNLDLTCIDRLASLHFSLEDQLRMGFQWETLWFQSNCQFPHAVLCSMSPFVAKSSLPVLISFLLLSAFVKPTSPLDIDMRDVEQKLVSSGAFLGQSELLAAYMGAKHLNQGQEPTTLKLYLEQHFGLRLG